MSTSFFFPELLPGIARGADGKSFVFDHRNEEKFKAYNSTVPTWLNAAHEEAKFDAEQDEDIRRRQYYIQYILGNQWPSARASYRSSAVDNRIWRLVWELVALLTDLRPVGQVKSTWPNEFLDSETMLNGATKGWWLESDADLKLALIIIYGILGTGFGKLQWNPLLRQGKGDFELLPLGPLSCLCLKPTDTDLQSSQAVIYEATWPLWKFPRRFGARGAMVKPDPQLSKYTLPGRAPMTMTPSMFAELAPQLQRLVGTPAKDMPTAYPLARYREFWFMDGTLNPANHKVLIGEPGTKWAYWVEPGQPLYPRGRMIAMGGENIILRDGPNPYWHGQFPFDVMRLNIVPWSFFGISELRPLIPLQDVVNNILAGVIDLVKKAVNPALIGPRTALSDAVWEALDTAKPGQKIATNMLAGGQIPQFSPPPNLPSWVMTTLMLAAREMDQSSGMAAVGQAVQKKQVPSGETLEEIKEVQQTPVRLKGRNIEVFLRNHGTMNISNIYQFYSEKRRMFFAGKPGKGGAEQLEHFDWIPNQAVPRLSGQEKPAFDSAQEYARNFIFKIHPGSLLNINHVEKTMTIMRLRMMKDIDRRHMYEVLDLGINIDEVEQNLKAEAQQQAEVLAAQRAVLMQQELIGKLGAVLKGGAGAGAGA